MANAVLPTGTDSAFFDVDSGQIAQLATGAAARNLSAAADCRIESGYLAPGRIDLQIYGAFGTNFMVATKSDWSIILS